MRRRSIFALLVMLALALFTIACEPSPEELMAKGKAASNQGKYEEALEYYNQVLEQQPDSTAVITAIGDVYIEQGNADKVVEHYENAISRASDDGQRRAYQSQAAVGYLMQAEAMWRKGEYRTNPNVEGDVEQKLEKAIEPDKKSATAQSAYKLLIALYDYQFERLRAATDAETDPAKKQELFKKELAHIEKVRSTVRPPDEFKKRMRARLEELNREQFFTAAAQRFEEKIKPTITAVPGVTLTADRIAMQFKHPVLPSHLEGGLLAPEATPEQKAEMMAYYQGKAKEWTVDQVEPVVAGLAGAEKLGTSIRADRIETFKIDSETIAEEMPVVDPNAPPPETPPAAVPTVTIVGSIALEELREMAFQFDLDRKTSEKSADGKPKPAGDGAAAPADGAAAPADGTATPPADGGAAPADGGEAPPAEGDGAAPAEGGDAPTEEGAPAEGGEAAPPTE